MTHFQKWSRAQLLAMWRSLFPWRRFIMRDWWAVVLWPVRRANAKNEGLTAPKESHE